MSMTPAGGRGAGSPRELSDRRRRLERKRLSRIEADVRDGRRKFLNDRDRLEAALIVTRLFDKARRAGHRRAGIDNRLKNNLGGFGTAGIRLDRWVLKRGDTVVDEAIVERHRDSKNPQRRIATYFTLVEFFAHLLGEDAEPHKLDMVRQTSLWREGDDDEREPHRRLADLLHECARSVANRTDFAALFSKAKRLHVGWNLENEPEAVPLEPDLDGMFDERTPAVLVEAYENAAPPFPAVKIARVPFGFLDETFLIETAPHTALAAAERFLDPASGEPAAPCDRVAARAIGYWDIWLCIAPVNSRCEIGAVFMEGSSMDLILRDGDYYETAQVLREPDFDLLAASVAPEGQTYINDEPEYAPWLWTKAGWRRFTVASTVEAEQSHEQAFWRAAVYRHVAEDDPLGRNLPGMTAAAHAQQRLVRFLAVDAHHVRHLLDAPRRGSAGLRLSGEFQDLSTISLLEPRELREGLWHRNPASLAHHVECALRDGAIERGWEAWMKAFSASMAATEDHWLNDVDAAERQLRQRWREAEGQAHAE